MVEWPKGQCRAATSAWPPQKWPSIADYHYMSLAGQVAVTEKSPYSDLLSIWSAALCCLSLHDLWYAAQTAVKSVKRWCFYTTFCTLSGWNLFLMIKNNTAHICHMRMWLFVTYDHWECHLLSHLQSGHRERVPRGGTYHLFSLQLGLLSLLLSSQIWESFSSYGFNDLT